MCWKDHLTMLNLVTLCSVDLEWPHKSDMPGFNSSKQREKERKRHYICVRLSYKCLRIVRVSFWNVYTHVHTLPTHKIKDRVIFFSFLFFLSDQDELSISMQSVSSILLCLSTEKRQLFLLLITPQADHSGLHGVGDQASEATPLTKILKGIWCNHPAGAGPQLDDSAWSTCVKLQAAII